MEIGGRHANARAHEAVTWTILKSHLLEVGLTQNRETTALHTLKTVDLLYFIMCEDPHE